MTFIKVLYYTTVLPVCMFFLKGCTLIIDIAIEY